ncbi:MAG: ribonuclease HII [Oscillospiraceae bacterium]
MLLNCYQNEFLEAGCDEAGRGCLAGPVFAAAVILPKDFNAGELNDSKKLSEKKREALYPLITGQAVAWAVGFATEQEIDEYNILQATYLAMRRAVMGLSKIPDYLLVDGNRDPLIGLPTATLVKGDAKAACIAAASILAKVTRDRKMVEMDQLYPQYGFAKHKGYPSPAHYAALARYGPCPIHRRSFTLTREVLPK